jgi:hypothetical protein
MSHSGITLKITISGDNAVARALSAAIDGSKYTNGIFVLESGHKDIGDMRAQLNSTLRVINAALESMEKVK